MQPCPCCSQKAYSECCEPLLRGDSYPNTAEQLMRSRYCAFVNKDIDYLLNTFCPSHICNDDALTLKQTMASIQWRGLRVLRAVEQKTAANKAHGEVDFVAFFSKTEQPTVRASRVIEQLHERSRFVFNERWYYKSGAQLPNIKLQRNEPCFCGSGKKLKKCCHEYV